MLAEFIKVGLVNAVMLQPFILALVTLYGRFGAEGKLQLGLSVLTGLVLGVAAQIAALGVPVDFAGWFALFIYGLIPGLVASGLYETGKGLVERG